ELSPVSVTVPLLSTSILPAYQAYFMDWPGPTVVSGLNPIEPPSDPLTSKASTCGCKLKRLDVLNWLKLNSGMIGGTSLKLVYAGTGALGKRLRNVMLTQSPALTLWSTGSTGPAWRHT